MHTSFDGVGVRRSFVLFFITGVRLNGLFEFYACPHRGAGVYVLDLQRGFLGIGQRSFLGALVMDHCRGKALGFVSWI